MSEKKGMPLSSIEVESALKLLSNSRYFHKVPLSILNEFIQSGENVFLKSEEEVPLGGESFLYVLLDGQLVIESDPVLSRRIETPGDVFGDLVSTSNFSTNEEVVAESDTKLLRVDINKYIPRGDSEQSPSAGHAVMAHVLSERLRVLTAQFRLRNSSRRQIDRTATVAVIDTSETDRQLMAGTLRQSWPGVRVIEYSDLSSFVSNPLEHTLHLVIADPEGPHGYKTNDEACVQIADAIRLCLAPLIVISKLCSSSQQREHLSGIFGGSLQAFLSKPYSSFDLQHLLERQRVEFLRARELERVEEEADTDPLLDIANRRRMNETLEALGALYAERLEPFSIVALDVDHFKNYNDTHGHPKGDVVLKTVASILKSRIRRGDLAARSGGEEFIVILPNCRLEVAKRIAGKLRKAIESEHFPFEETQPMGKVTATFGVACYPDDGVTIEKLLERADRRLYLGKEKGRNVVVFEGN